MPATDFFYKKAKLHYTKIGEGEKTLLFFHGYGQNHQVFKEKAEALRDSHTCYLFDLFFHGESEWGYGEEVLTKEYWNELIEIFLMEQKIDRFSLVGFSLGGRFVFTTLEALPHKIENIYLLAPDGVKTNFWYSLATYPIAFRKLFKSMILHPNRFFSVATFIHQLRLVDKGLIRFAESQMKTEEMRKRVYYSWVIFRILKFDMPQIAHLIRKHTIKTTMVIGRFDKVITEKNMKNLLNHLPECTVTKLETGHNGLIEKWRFF